MTTNLITLLTDVATNVLEQQAFAFVEPCLDTQTETPNAPILRLSISYQGSTSGTLTLWMPYHLSIDLAANILGTDSNDAFAKNDAPDAMKEVLNVICGQMLTQAYGVNEIFSLSIPIHQSLSQSEWEYAKTCADTVALYVDDAPILLHAESLEAQL